jgi:uncharacterized cupredoxin-like copper-binding protein
MIREVALRRNCGTVIAAGTLVLMSCVASIARADTAVNIVLQDASSGGNLSGMKMTATPDSVKAGRIKVNATNESQGLVHEVIVVASPPNGKLPYDEKVGRVIESRIKDLGERSDLSPGKSGSLRWATSKRGQVGAHPLRDRSRIIWKTKGVPTVGDKYTIA